MKAGLLFALAAISFGVAWLATDIHAVVRLYPYSCYGSGFKIIELGGNKIFTDNGYYSEVKPIRWIYQNSHGETCVGEVKR